MATPGIASWLTAALAAASLLVADPARAKLSKGDPAPSFELATVNGGSVSSQSTAEGGLTILTFFSLDSQPSRELLIRLSGLFKELANQGLAVVAIAAAPPEALKEFATQEGLGYSVCADGSKQTIERYAAEDELPITYLIAPGGLIAEVIRGSGTGAEVPLAVASKQLARGYAASASELYSGVAKADPENVEARVGLGFALAKEGKLERAEQELKSLEDTGPQGAAAASEGLAEVWLRKGDLDGALNQIAKAPADSSYGHLLRGEIAARRGDLGEAARQFDAAAAKPAAFAWQTALAFNNLASVSGTRGDDGGALKNYDKAISAEPFLLEAHSNKGATLAKAGRIEEAKKMLLAAKSLAPADELVATLLRHLEEQAAGKADLERQILINQSVNELVEAYRGDKLPPPPPDEWSPRALVVSFLDFQSKLGPLWREGLSEAFLVNLTRRLQDSGRVKVIEREVVDKLLAELKLGSPDLADPATRLRLGRALGASVIGTGGFVPREAKTELQLRLVDTETTDIRCTMSEELADPASVGAFADRIADKIVKTLRAGYPLRGKIASIEGGEIIVGVGGKHGAQSGLRFRVVEEGQAVEVDGEVIGRKQQTIGTLELTRIEDGFAYANAVDGSGFKKGQHLIEAAP